MLDEAELSLTLRLRELKTQYRQQYEELRGTKAEVSYCQHLVDQCRTRLLTGEHSNSGITPTTTILHTNCHDVSWEKTVVP